MGHKFAEIAFTPGVQRVQEQMRSRRGYARLLGGEAHHDRLGPSEAEFIGARDSFYIASVGETGWPYIQHRGGSKGFLRVLDDKTIGFADFSGNRQYVTVGNIGGDGRVSLFLMDYPNRTRLKIVGHAREVGRGDVALERLIVPGYGARVERGILVTVAAFDCVNGGATSGRRGGVKLGQSGDIADMHRGPIGPLCMSAAKTVR